MKESIFLLRTLQLLSYGVAKESGSLWYSLCLTWWHPVYLGLGPALTWTGLPNQWLDSNSLKIVLSLKKTRPFKYYFSRISFFSSLYERQFLISWIIRNIWTNITKVGNFRPKPRLITFIHCKHSIFWYLFCFCFCFRFHFLPLLLESHFQRICTEEKLTLKYCTIPGSDKGAEL